MAQRKQLRGRNCGWEFSCSQDYFILAVAIFYVTGAGILGPKYRLITYLPEVEGLETGAPVRLDGVAVGDVQSIQLTPHPQDAAHNITLVLRIDKKYQNDIRTDSTASLITEGLLGNRYVTISRGLTGAVYPAERRRARQGRGGHEADGGARRGLDAESGRAVGRSARDRG